MKLDLLPRDCISQILCFLSPQAVCRVSLGSKELFSATTDSDIIWERFLPTNYQEILSRMVLPILCSSNKELFLRLCRPNLIDGGRKAISIEISTCKICYILSARELTISWASNPLYWTWKPLNTSRFAEVAELRTIWWLEIQAKMKVRMLSPNTYYAAYLIVRFEKRAYGLDTIPSKAVVEVGSQKSEATIVLRNPSEQRQNALGQQCFSGQTKTQRAQSSSARANEEEHCLKERENGWVEIKLGQFFNGAGNEADEEVKMSFREIKGPHLKGGLTVQGIEIRPIN